MESVKIQWARKKIEQAIKQDGPYSHNVCSMALLAVAQADGKEAANKLIEEYCLDRLYRIQKVQS
ncbi:MAG: hypothetical protein HYT79_02680 [Elusimicrobia bacterium]|nr:hypothetical protein [Elusimicrobiota bacterium]